MNNAVINGHSIVLSSQTQNKLQNNEKANVLIKNINKDVTQKDVFDLFSAHGTITSCKLECFNDGSSRGFAFI